MQTVNQIREAFLAFFAANGHEVVGSSSLVPLNDPTLMFTNAGMVQFKNVFTGAETRPYSRAATSQKCVRAGGKHNDLENVGYTARHHTFFEMLGNFSFGDYFKELAIELAWRLIAKEFGLPQERLLITVYADDDEAFGLWKKISGLPESRIIRNPTSDNFWSMGPTGPCGPCSEIFYDHGAHIPGGPPGSHDEGGDRFIEIWNLVFMQFEQLSEDTRHNLPKPSIDTGMGLERIAAVMQGVHDNYDIDLFKALIAASAEASGVSPDGDSAKPHRVIADHLRACCFLIADGVLPSNEGRGYVLRRIMRRAMRHARMMGCKEPLMHKLTPALTSQMGLAFPELARAEPLIKETLKLEETRFRQTLDRGLALLDEAASSLGEGGVLQGETAFKLYDTFGFPLDLTQDTLRARGLSVDVEGFNAAMRRQREEARKAWAGSGDAATESVWFDIREELGATEFLGYKTTGAEGTIVALVINGKRVEQAKTGGEVMAAVNQTPFYAESGGQQGDQGVIYTGDGITIHVTDTIKKLGCLHVHLGKVCGNHGIIRVGDQVHMAVDRQRRDAIRANHSATHLLHAALRRKLGSHAAQKGSLVAAGRLRFDISHPKAIDENELAFVEAEVNRRIIANSQVQTHLMTPAEAIKEGAMALFGEKYGDEVRVVAMGGKGGGEGGGEGGGKGGGEGGGEGGDKDGDYSLELCGGTHVARTGGIGLFKIIAESAVASGVRRIEALTGAAALDYLNAQGALLRQIAAHLKTAPAEAPARVVSLLDERKALERELAEARRKIAASGGGNDGETAKIKIVNGVKFLPRLLEDAPAKQLKGIADDLKAKIGSGVVALASVDGGKASLVVGVTTDLSEQIDAVSLARAGALAIGGKGGGGRQDMAQAGGPDIDKIDAALAAIETELNRILQNG